MLSARSASVPARAGHTDIRRNNQEVVLRHLWAVGSDSRAGIAARAGLTRATVSRLVGSLIELGLVEEAGVATGGGQGRPGTELRLAGRHVLAIGAEVNVDYLTLLVVDLANRQVHHWHSPFDAHRAGAEASLRALAEACSAWLDSLPERPAAGRRPFVAGLGVAIPGLVDERRGVVGRAPNLGWHDVPVAELLTAELGDRVGSVTVGNEANRAALAEYRVGSHAGTAHLVYVTGDVGIGGGLIVQGRPLLGARGYGGEVGHMLLDPAGPLCGCGRRGCWEAFVGLQALLAGVAEPSAAPGAGESSEERIARVVRRAEQGDETVLTALARLGEHVGTGCANIAALFDPDVIVLGGYFTAVARWIMAPARTALEARLLASPTPGTGELAVSDLGFAAAARGAATHIIDRVISDPHLLLATRRR
ncbi:ROK family transcriptional regulator [Streptomyces sp. NPDC052109]|uniref:ROK family transcriptional regulator n=1 Tax=Streptomyces sp. NPDC052109 TaxID=3155527 RepID=UPI003425B454